jgi:hypothetical protein
MARKMTIDEFIIKAKRVHGDTYDYSKAIYTGTYDLITIICPIHNEFSIKPTKHLGGYACKICREIRSKKDRNKSQEDFIAECNMVHNSKYNYSKTIYVNSHAKIVIICPIHKEFSQFAGDHMRGHGCKDCGLIKQCLKARMSFEDFVQKANKVHDNKYTYNENSYVGTMSSDLIVICCTIHGNFKQGRNSHLQGCGCQVCAHSLPLTVEEVIHRSKITHKDKYDYSLLTEIDQDYRVTIICRKHGIFTQSFYSHIAGCDCPICATEENANNRRYTLEDFIELANKVHACKYSYSKSVYVDTGTKIIITCPDHGDFSQKPNNHLNNHGCPICVHMISKEEINWLDELKIPKEYRQQTIKVNSKKYRLDAFDPNTNTVYEFNGDFCHGNPTIYPNDKLNPIAKKTFGQLYQRTLTKEQNLIKAGYQVISIWESDYLKLKDQ